MVSTRSLLCFLLVLLVGTCLEGVLGASDGDGNEESFLDTASTAIKDLGQQSSQHIKKAVKSSSALTNRILSAVHSGAIAGINEVGDLADRTGHLVGTVLPEQSKRMKDAIGGTGEAALNHGTNQFQRVMSGGSTAIKAWDDASQTTLDAVTQNIETLPAKNVIQTLSKVGMKVNEMGDGAFKTAGEMATNPGEYAAAGLERVKSGVDYLSVLNPIPHIGNFASNYISSWGKKD